MPRVLHRTLTAVGRSLLTLVSPRRTPPAVLMSAPGRAVWTVAVEGNIASGKTTFLETCRETWGEQVSVQMEPTARWRDLEGHNLLSDMYRDPARWSLQFQTYVQLTMLQQHTAPSSSGLKLMERSLHSARYCFVENLRRAGLMTASEYAVLDAWYHWIVTTQPVAVDCVVYLRSSPHVCLQRLRDRGRHEEKTVSLDYLTTLHTLHEAWLGGGEESGEESGEVTPVSTAPGGRHSGVPVLTLDCHMSPRAKAAAFGVFKEKVLRDEPRLNNGLSL